MTNQGLRRAAVVQGLVLAMCVCMLVKTRYELASLAPTADVTGEAPIGRHMGRRLQQVSQGCGCARAGLPLAVPARRM